jgi:hypothetical protein
MAKMDAQSEPLNSFNVSDLSSFESKKLPPNLQEFEPVDLSDVDFAHNRLSLWGHPAAITHIIEVIHWDLVQERERLTPSVQRLRALFADPRYKSVQLANDPYGEDFERAQSYAQSDEQSFALSAVQKLHLVTLSTELSISTVDPHIRALVEAILIDPYEA